MMTDDPGVSGYEHWTNLSGKRRIYAGRQRGGPNRTHNVTADTGHPGHAKVELVDAIGKTRPLQEWHDERSQAAVYVHPDVVSLGKGCEVNNRVLSR